MRTHSASSVSGQHSWKRRPETLETNEGAFFKGFYWGPLSRLFYQRKNWKIDWLLTLVLNCLKFLDDYTICQRTNAGAGIIEKMFSLHFQWMKLFPRFLNTSKKIPQELFVTKSIFKKPCYGIFPTLKFQFYLVQLLPVTCVWRINNAFTNF